MIHFFLSVANGRRHSIWARETNKPFARYCYVSQIGGIVRSDSIPRLTLIVRVGTSRASGRLSCLAGEIRPSILARDAMNISEAPGALKKFRRTAWKCQQTFLTPMNDLRSFVTGIVSASEQMKSGCVTIEQAVFEPTKLLTLLASHSIPARYARGISLTAARQQEIATLLHAIFSDWIDFIFVPEPRSFAIYADHDEYTRAFSPTHARTSIELLRLSSIRGSKWFQTTTGVCKQFREEDSTEPRFLFSTPD